MKSFRLLVLSLLTATLTGVLSAQTAAPSVPAAKAIEPTRIAYVNSSAFLESATGIKQLVKVFQALELEFSPQQSELSLMNEKLRTLVGELGKLNTDPVTNAKAIEEKQIAGLALQKDLQAKQQAAQQAFAARQQETQGPVAAEVGKSLRAFSAERNIGLMFDIAKLGDAVLDAKPELDLTADFIAYFNASHP